MKRIINVLIISFIVLILVGCNPYKDFTFALKEDDTYELVKYDGKKEDVLIPEVYKKKAVTSIAESAFKDCNALISIVIPNSITTIGEAAFSGCDALENMVMPFVGRSRSTIDLEAALFGYIFEKDLNNESSSIKQNYDLDNSNNYFIPASLQRVELTDAEYISYGAFMNCNSLVDIILSESITVIDDFAFYGCSSLTSIIIPDSTITMGTSLFGECVALENMVLPFIGASREPLEPNLELFGYIFGSDEYEGAIKTEQSYGWDQTAVSYIPISLTTVTISASITQIAEGAFSNVYADIIFLEGSSLTTIENDTFEDYKGKSISLSSNITSIENNSFKDTPNLETFNVSEANLVYSSIDGVLYNKEATELVKYPNGKPATTYVTLDSVTNIGVGAFSRCNNLTSVTLSENVSSIGDFAFIECRELFNINISENVTSIGKYAFVSCINLTTLNIPSSLISLDDAAFMACLSLVDVVMPEGLVTIGEYAFSSCTSLMSISIPTSVTSIGGFAFDNCSADIIFLEGSKITTIERDIFYEYKGTSITLSNTLTSLGDYAFNSCVNLVSMIIPNSVVSIGEGVFVGCEGLTSLTLSENLTSIGDYNFNGCISLTSLVIPISVTNVGEMVFWNFNDITIYVEAETKPVGWSDDWNFSNRPVVWGYIGE